MVSRVVGVATDRLTANITEFPVLEDQEVLSLGYLLKSFDCPVREIVYDIGMRLEHTYRIADFFC